MNVNELRIGNFVSDNTKLQCVVIGLNPFSHSVRCDEAEGCDILIDVYRKDGGVDKGYECDSNHCLPIPITEEWLIKLGFEKSDYPNFTRKVSALTMTCRIQIGINYSEFGGIYFGDKFQYVHQLQNFIFAVSGQEICATQP